MSTEHVFLFALWMSYATSKRIARLFYEWAYKFGINCEGISYLIRARKTGINNEKIGLIWILI